MNGFADRGLDEDNFTESSSGIISGFDAFPKVKRTYRTSTNNGDIWTLVLVVFCIWLTSTEFWRWMQGDTTTLFSVEKGISHDLQINIDIVIPMQCVDLHVNVQDASGDRILASEMLEKNPTRWAQWETGMVHDNRGDRRRKGEGHLPYWFHSQALQYKEQVDVHNYLRMAKHKRHWSNTPPIGKRQTADSCRIFGSIEGNKVQGDFHITARGHGYQGAFPEEHLDHKKFNFSHHINELSFGPFFPAINQPLDNALALTEDHFYKYQYYLSIVPTIYTDAAEKIKTSTPPHIDKRRRAELEAKKLKPRDQMTQEEIWAEEDREEERQRKLRGGSIQQMAIGIKKNKENPNEPNAARDRGIVGNDASPFYNPFETGRNNVFTNQYAVTEQSHAISEQSVPGLFFKYDIEPILLTVSEEWGGVLGLIVRSVNVIAGVLVAGGWIISLIGWVDDVWSRRRKRAGSSGGLLYTSSGEKSSLD